jgi:hypothetical protein
MEVARAWYYEGDRGKALDALEEARAVSPQQVRYRPIARELTYSIDSAEARPTERLRSLMPWLGIG